MSRKTNVSMSVAHNESHVKQTSAKQGITIHLIPGTQYGTRYSLLYNYLSDILCLKCSSVGLRRDKISQTATASIVVGYIEKKVKYQQEFSWSNARPVMKEFSLYT
jgi:hypothetical protein